MHSFSLKLNCTIKILKRAKQSINLISYIFITIPKILPYKNLEKFLEIHLILSITISFTTKREM